MTEKNEYTHIKGRTLSRRSFLVGAGVAALGTLTVTGLGGCSETPTESADAAVETSDGLVTLKAEASVTPHQDILRHAASALEAKGVKVDIVSNDDNLANQQLASKDIDFNYVQHQPYLDGWNEQNGTDLVSAGGIHVEPITAYSDTYTDKDQIPDNATVAIPNDPSNEYRALRILEQNGFITLDKEAETSLTASVKNITEYHRDLNIIEIDSAQIIPTKSDYDFFITNTNKVLESKITSTKLFSEEADSPYANIITVRSEDEGSDAIKALVEVLQSDEVQQWINDNYEGAVIGSVHN